MLSPPVLQCSMELNESQEKFRAAWRSVLSECESLGSQRGEQYGETFASDMVLVSRETALLSMIAVKVHRLSTAEDDATIDDTLLDLICYCAMLVAARREACIGR